MMDAVVPVKLLRDLEYHLVQLHAMERAWAFGDIPHLDAVAAGVDPAALSDRQKQLRTIVDGYDRELA